MAELPQGFTLDSNTLPEGFQLDPPTPPPNFTSDESVTKFQPTVREGVSFIPQISPEPTPIDVAPSNLPLMDRVSEGDTLTPPVGATAPQRDEGLLSVPRRILDVLSTSEGRDLFLTGLKKYPEHFVKGIQELVETPGAVLAGEKTLTPEQESAFGLNVALGTIGRPFRFGTKSDYGAVSSPQTMADFLSKARSGLPAEGIYADFQRETLKHFGYDETILRGMTTEELASAYRNFTDTLGPRNAETPTPVSPSGRAPPEPTEPLALPAPEGPVQPGGGGAAISVESKRIPTVEGTTTPTPLRPALASRFEEPTTAPSPVFYSTLRRVVEEKLPNSASAEQIMATVKNQPGVKAEEIEYTGLQNFVNGFDGAPVPKGEIIGHLEDSQVRVEEVVKGYTLNVSVASYGEYTLPGPKQNYRELLLTLPPETKTVVDIARGFGTKQVPTPEKTYQSPHFNEPNILAHIRFTERNDVNSQPLLFVEEIQSDWHQKGRKEGYKGPQDLDLTGWKAVVDPRTVSQEYKTYTIYDTQGQLKGHAQGISEQSALQAYSSLGVPDAPFKTSWPDLAFKRMLRWAADSGFDRLAWANGREISAVVAPGSKEALQGNIEFYDKILPSIAEKWAKRLGGEIGQTLIPEVPDPKWPSWHRVSYLTIPPRAKTIVQQGLPLFSRLAKQGDITVARDIALTAEQPFHSEAIKVAGVLKTLNTKFDINAPVRIHLFNQLGKQVDAGRVWPRVDGSYDIELNVAQHKDAAQLYSTALHEFGHVVMFEKFAKLPTEQQLAIRGLWHNFRLATPNSQTLLQLWNRRDNAVTNFYNLRGDPNRSGKIPLYALSPEMRKYWSSFDEWFAEQVARWGTSSERPLGLAEKGFQGLGRTLNALFREATKKLGMNFEPEPRMKEWLDSFIDTGIPTGHQVYPVVDQRTQQANQRLFDRSEPELRASEQQVETNGMRDALRSIFPSGVSKDLEPLPAFADKINWFYKLNIHAYQMLELNPHIVPFQRYMEKIRSAELEEAQINDSAIRTMKDWDGLKVGQDEKVAVIIDDVTNMVYRTPQEKARGVARHPTAQEFQSLVRQYKLTPEAVAVFNRIRKMFDMFVKLNEGLAITDAMRISDPQARMNAVTAIQAHTAALLSRPYFPFMRFGNHVVLVRNSAGNIVYREHAEGRGLISAEGRQKRLVEELKKSFGPGFTVEPDLLKESVRSLEGMPATLLTQIENKLSVTTQQRDALEQLKFELAPAHSFIHRMQHKNYIPGYSQDFKRAFSQYFFHGAKWYTRAKYVDALRGHIQEVRDQANTTSLTPIKRKEIANFMADHLQNGFLAPAQDFITLKGAAVLMTLGFVPLSAAVNMSQVPMVSLPFLGAKFNDVGAGTALAKAIADWTNYYKKGKYNQFTDFHSRAIAYAIHVGRLDQTIAAELASWSQGSNLGTGYGGNTFQRGAHELMQKAMWMFEMAEKWNRRITFSATLDLAMKHPNMKFIKETLPKYTDEIQRMVGQFTQAEAEAIVTAMHVVDQTQFMASQASRPKLMRGKLGTLFLYKRFVQGLLFTTMNNKSDVLPRFLIIALGIAGLTGIPGYDDLKEISRALGWHLFGKDFDLNREIRRYVSGLTDEKWTADQVIHGTARMSFGIPWLLDMLGNKTGLWTKSNVPKIDMSNSIGVGPILPVELGKMFGPPLKGPAENFGEQSARVGGVTSGLAFNIYKALASRDNPGDAKRWESAMPRFARNLSHAYRAFSEEKERGRGDTAIIRYDTRDPEHLGEILGLAMGAQPRRLTAKWNEIRDQNEVTRFFDLQRSMLLEQWTDAARKGDRKELERMKIATQEFYRDLPDWAKSKALTSDTIRKSIETRLRTQAIQEMGLTVQKSNIPIAREIQRLHPESTVDVRRVR